MGKAFNRYCSKEDIQMASAAEFLKGQHLGSKEKDNDIKRGT